MCTHIHTHTLSHKSPSSPYWIKYYMYMEQCLPEFTEAIIHNWAKSHSVVCVLYASVFGQDLYGLPPHGLQYTCSYTLTWTTVCMQLYTGFTRTHGNICNSTTHSQVYDASNNVWYNVPCEPWPALVYEYPITLTTATLCWWHHTCTCTYE